MNLRFLFAYLTVQLVRCPGATKCCFLRTPVNRLYLSALQQHGHIVSAQRIDLF